ncbi:MAG: TonB-dependent receptor [Gammaproteobacteria bacterium]|nr:TonB-dependent receptor [Gammaproteobacteria bacterium]
MRSRRGATPVSRYPSIGNLGYRILPAYSRVDVRTTWQSADEVWAVTGYVQNVFDEIGIQEYAFDWGWLTEPRQIWIQVRYRPQL